MGDNHQYCVRCGLHSPDNLHKCEICDKCNMYKDSNNQDHTCRRRILYCGQCHKSIDTISKTCLFCYISECYYPSCKRLLNVKDPHPLCYNTKNITTTSFEGAGYSPTSPPTPNSPPTPTKINEGATTSRHNNNHHDIDSNTCKNVDDESDSHCPLISTYSVGIDKCNIEFSIDLRGRGKFETPQDFLRRNAPQLINEINIIFEKHMEGPVKMHFQIEMKWRKLGEDLTTMYHTSTFSSRCFTHFAVYGEITPEEFQDAIQSIQEGYDDANNEGSGWVLLDVHYINLITSLATHSCMVKQKKHFTGNFQPIPKGVGGNKTLINIDPRNKTGRVPEWYNCLDMCIRVHFAIKDTNPPHEVSWVKNKTKFQSFVRKYYGYGDRHVRLPDVYGNPEMKQYTLSQHSWIEETNGISIWTYVLVKLPKIDGENLRYDICLLRKGCQIQNEEENRINLLIVGGDHAVYISNLNVFLSLFRNKKKGTPVCELCMSVYKSQSNLQSHKQHEICSYGNKFHSKIVLPPEGSTLRFKKLHKTIPPYLVCYADAESLLKLLETHTHDRSYTALHHHQMVSFGYCIVDGNSGKNLAANIIYGPDVARRLL